MPDPDEGASLAAIPPWAMEQARAELYDVRDPAVLEESARRIARERREREDERHDEYDDPDEGGEA